MTVAFAAASVFVMAGGSGEAAPTSVTFVGSLIDVPFNWRTSVPSEFNLSGVNILGADGYYIPGAAQRILTPAYVVTLSPSESVSAGNVNYASIDDPSTTPGDHPSTLTTGAFSPIPGTGNSTASFGFTLGGAVPGLIQVGILEDNLDSSSLNSSAVQLVGRTA